MTADQSDLRVENALLRGSLWLATRALRGYHDAPHFEIDDHGVPKMEVIVQQGVREKAGDALERADRLLQAPERGR
jgi:hypothetical protein